MNIKKKKVKKKKMATVGRPRKNSPAWVHLGLRVNKDEAGLIARAVAHEAERLHLMPSQNSFCLRASVAAAKKELGIEDDVTEADEL